MVDDADFEWLNQWKWQVAKFKHTNYARMSMMIDGKWTRVFMHRIILKLPDDVHADHVNRNGLDNQRHNLRPCTRSQNQGNRGMLRNNTSGVKGVVWCKPNQNWQVHIQGKHVGNFETLEGAKVARRLAEIAVWGEFAPPSSS